MFLDIHGDIWTDVTIKRGMGRKNIIRDDHLERFKSGGMVGGIFVIWADPPHDQRPKERLVESIKAMSCELWESRDFLKVMLGTDDFYTAMKEDKMAVMLGLEGLSCIGEEVEDIYTLYQLGFRHAILTWNEQNDLATGVKGDLDRGLTQKGKEAIKIINDLGIILDVSHANEKTFWDICNETEVPFMASHSNARALCDVSRNLTDNQIKAIGEKKGLIGMNSFNEFISFEPENMTVDFLINHLEHVVDLIGIDCVALGFDFFDYLEGDTTNSFTSEAYKGTIGLENITKGNNMLTKLEKRGFSKGDIEKISYKNFLSLMDRVLK
jgi:membrane dipeptidase